MNKFRKVISKFSKAKILVIGDLILDEYVWGRVERISPEAPVPVVWVDRQSYMPGGASNVANNIRSLEGGVYIAGVTGSDERSERLLELLSSKGIRTDGVVCDADRPTTLKTRIIAGHQQVVRVDREKVDHLSGAILKGIIAHAKRIIPKVDAVIIEDYGKGVITPSLLKAVVGFARSHKKIITVDPKEEHFSYYRGVTSITPNNHEASVASGIKIKDRATLKAAGERILRRIGSDSVLITLGENGMCLFGKNRRMTHIPTAAQEVFDVSGAGDTVISVFTLAMACGANILDAAKLANIAAGIVVGKVGVAVTNQQELIDRIGDSKNQHGTVSNKTTVFRGNCPDRFP
jgi:D-beta-D-heptose 7-phosphate kinase/D-beta-D-heptose 1-phosphate adenosyltransferase